jgi:hypothetical protein
MENMVYGQFSDFIAATLGEPAAAGLGRFLIVDTAATRPVDMSALLSLREEAWDILCSHPCNWREAAGPVLITLPAEAWTPTHCHTLAMRLAQYRYANCFVYLEISLDDHRVRRALKDRTEAMLPDNLPVLLRYFDPRIFNAMLPVLAEQQRDEFLSIGLRWAFPGRRGELHLVERSGRVGIEDFLPPLHLTVQQQAAMIEAGEVDAMVDLLLSQNNDQLLALLPPDQHLRVQRSLIDASRFGLNQLTDQAMFCSLALQLGSDFHEQAPWAEGLGRIKVGELTLADLLTLAAEQE